MWDSFVELLRATIFSAAHVFGGSLGGGIFLVSLGVRLALLPLTLRLARRSREQQAKIAALKPQLDALRLRFANDPARLFTETRALHQKHGIKIMTPSSLAGLAIQLPVLGALFSAVRSGLGSKVPFLWVADLARPNPVLILGVAALTALGVLTTPAVPGQATNAQTAMTIVSVVMTIVFLWSASSAIAVSMSAGAVVSALQNWMLGRDQRHSERSEESV